MRLLVEPSELAMQDLGAFRVGLRVTNAGPTTMDPAAHRATLRVDGKDSFAWTTAIGNGTREAAWHALPPGRSVELSWALGEALFEAPGTYELVLRLGDLEDRATVRVVP